MEILFDLETVLKLDIRLYDETNLPKTFRNNLNNLTIIHMEKSIQLIYLFPIKNKPRNLHDIIFRYK